MHVTDDGVSYVFSMTEQLRMHTQRASATSVKHEKSHRSPRSGTSLAAVSRLHPYATLALASGFTAHAKSS